MRLFFAATVVASTVFALGVGGADAAGFDSASTAPSVKLVRLVTQLPAGQQWLILQNGPFCIPISSQKSQGQAAEADLKMFGPAFTTGFEASSGTAVDQPVDLFGETKNPSAADYQVGGVIRALKVTSCMQGLLGVKNEASMSVEWQIYSARQGKVVATAETSEAVKLKSASIDTTEVLRQVFVNNARQLSSRPEIKSLLSSKLEDAAIGSPPAGGDRLTIHTAAVKSRPVTDTVGSVVLVSLGDSFGSGVLVSGDGYVLTNEHVVGRAKAVRIRWSDGFETAGEVVRTHRGRDVALIKTDARGREPIPIRLAGAQPGETVLAIGAPIDKGLQGTITRGIFSANRIVDGYSFIQSDVGVNHGNSGGPLLDDKGYVIGLTDIGLQPNGSPIGLNFFIPIKDALDFLNLDLVQSQAEPPPVQKASTPRTDGKVSAHR